MFLHMVGSLLSFCLLCFSPKLPAFVSSNVFLIFRQLFLQRGPATHTNCHLCKQALTLAATAIPVGYHLAACVWFPILEVLTTAAPGTSCFHL